MTAFIYRPEKACPPCSDLHRVSFDGVILKPGMNQVGSGLTEEEAQKLLQHPDLARYKEWNAIEVIEASDRPKETNPNQNEGQDLSQYSPEQAEKMVFETVNSDLLKKWLKTETRPDIRKAINRKLAEIKAGNE